MYIRICARLLYIYIFIYERRGLAGREGNDKKHIYKKSTRAYTIEECDERVYYACYIYIYRYVRMEKK